MHCGKIKKNPHYDKPLRWSPLTCGHCPASVILSDTRIGALLDLNHWVERTGNLPEPGGLWEQEDWTMRHLKILAQEFSRIECEKMKPEGRD